MRVECFTLKICIGGIAGSSTWTHNDIKELDSQLTVKTAFLRSKNFREFLELYMQISSSVAVQINYEHF